MVLEGLYRSKLQDSVQLQTVLFLCEQENIRHDEQPSYSRLKTSVRRRIDQTMRTRNFRAQNEIVEKGAVTKTQKERKPSMERTVGECYQWKAIGQCLKETHVVSVKTPRLKSETKKRRNLAPRKICSQSSMRLGENIYKLKNAEKATFYSPK